jgi:endoglucanase
LRSAWSIHPTPTLFPGTLSKTTRSCAGSTTRAGFLLHTEPAIPLWVGEFGTCQTLDCGDNSQWFRWFVEYLRGKDLSWSYWPLNGTQSSGVSRKYGEVETYGLLAPDYRRIGAPKVVELLRTIENPPH